MATKAKTPGHSRVAARRHVIVDVLTEAGYRCSVPTCRGILALDLHHVVPVPADGPKKKSSRGTFTNPGLSSCGRP
jgi:hypothetical protein